MATVWSGTISAGETTFGPYPVPAQANGFCRVEFMRGGKRGQNRKAGEEWPTDATFQFIVEHSANETGPWAFVFEGRSSGANEDGKAEDDLAWFMHDFRFPTRFHSGFVRVRTIASHDIKTDARINWR